ncbi:hypothetical protein DXG01_014387, partial [Tephrocybe rancida]
PSPAPTPAQVPHGGATPLGLHALSIIALAPGSTSPPTSADLHLVPSTSMTSSQPVQSSPSLSSETPPHKDLKNGDNAEAGTMPATGAQTTTSPVALPHQPLTADLNTIDPRVQLAKDLKWFYSLHDAVKRSANNGRVSPVEALSQEA